MESAKLILRRSPQSYELHAAEILAMANKFHHGHTRQMMEQIAAGYQRLAESVRRIEANELELMRDWQP
jgi:hypothetical protein